MIPVLYVDDDPELLELGTLFLERSGEISVDTARQASEASERMASCTYECIISDYQIPGMDGIAFLQELRSGGNTTPFILFTSYGSGDVRKEAYRNGAFAVINKDSTGKNVFYGLTRTIYWAVLYQGSDL